MVLLIIVLNASMIRMAIQNHHHQGQVMTMNDGYQYIREHYQVPAKIGMKIKFQGREGEIIASIKLAHYLTVRLLGDTYPVYLHPTWEVEYPSIKGRIDSNE